MSRREVVFPLPRGQKPQEFRFFFSLLEVRRAASRGVTFIIIWPPLPQRVPSLDIEINPNQEAGAAIRSDLELFKTDVRVSSSSPSAAQVERNKEQKSRVAGETPL